MVLDANDNAPVISQVPDAILISEATLISSQVITVTATDEDVGNNGLFSFHGYSADGKFVIDSKSGVVKTASAFDFEQQSRFVTTKQSLLKFHTVWQPKIKRTEARILSAGIINWLFGGGTL